MIRKYKNSELEEILTGAVQLGSYPMPGELTLAVISARKALKRAYDNYNEACRQIGESRCEKDKAGRPQSVFQKDEKGNDLLSFPKKLRFKDEHSEAEALRELNDLGRQEVDIEVREYETSLIEGLRNITPIQMEALLALVALKGQKEQPEGTKRKDVYCPEKQAMALMNDQAVSHS